MRTIRTYPHLTLVLNWQGNPSAWKWPMYDLGSSLLDATTELLDIHGWKAHLGNVTAQTSDDYGINIGL